MRMALMEGMVGTSGRAGDEIELSLAEIPSSGYRWTLHEVPGALELIFDGRDPGPGRVSAAFGAQRTRTFLFKVREDSADRVQLVVQLRRGADVARERGFTVRLG